MPRRPSKVQREALKQLYYLYKLSVQAASEGDFLWPQVLGKHIDRLYLKYRLKPFVKRKELVCKNCKTTHVPGVTTRVRIRRSSGKTYIIYTCRNCGYQWKKIIRHKGREYKKMPRNTRLYDMAWRILGGRTREATDDDKP